MNRRAGHLRKGVESGVHLCPQRQQSTLGYARQQGYSVSEASRPKTMRLAKKFGQSGD